jgi:hypothetical protein
MFFTAEADNFPAAAAASKCTSAIVIALVMDAIVPRGEETIKGGHFLPRGRDPIMMVLGFVGKRRKASRVILSEA